MTVSDIEKDQRFLLAAAYAYNNGIEWVSDKIYDMHTAWMIRMRDTYYDLWSRSEVYPDIFIQDDAWTYTSQHFPQDDVVKGWYEDYRKRNG